MNSRLSRWCDGVMEAGWLIAVVAVPLFFNIHSERVFEPDKLTLLRSVSLIMAAAWITKFVDQRGWRALAHQRWSNPDAIWHKPFVLPVLGLILVYALSTIFSVNPRVSLLGSYQRLQGTYSTLSYIVVFVIMTTTIGTRQQARRVVTTIIVTSLPIAFYGLLQHFDLDPLPWGGNVSERVAGHMGNAIFIAAYLIMVIPLTLARIVDAFSNILGDEELAVADVVRSSIYVFILALQLIAVYWSGSRGPLLALGVGLFSFALVLLVSLRDAALEKQSGSGRGSLSGLLPAFLFVAPSVLALLLSPFVAGAFGASAAFLFFAGVAGLSVVAVFILVAVGRGWRWLWLAWILLTVFLGVWLILFNLPERAIAPVRGVPVVGGLIDTLEEWRDLPTIGSYGRMLDPGNTTGREKSGRVRVLIWEGVIDLISPHSPLQFPDGRADPFNFLRPLLGYGPETMYVTYNRFYPPELATVEARNASPDRSHNETFDALAITGLFGLLAWQALYLTVVYFGFRYLGVVRSRRDGRVLVLLWFGGALLAAGLAVLLTDPIYLGVAVPTGVIVGLITYLIYYALFSRRSVEVSEPAAARAQPFAIDRLLMNALVAAVLAHYVEIHFGIAIASTRLYFFVYIALMFVLGFRLNQQKSPAEAAPEEVALKPKADKRRRKAATTPTQPAPPASNGWSSLIVVGLLLALMIGIMGYSFITYALPPDKVITGPADLSPFEIIAQSLLQNAGRDFAPSPFIFGMILLTWGLGWLVYLSEMAKYEELHFNLSSGETLTNRKRLIAASLFALLAAAGVAVNFFTAEAGDAAGALGRSLALGWSLLSLLAAIQLFTGRSRARVLGGVVALAGLTLLLPMLFAGGGLFAVVLGVVSAAILFLLWDRAWSRTLLPAAGLAVGSLALGLIYVVLHAVRYKATLFFQQPSAPLSAPEIRALEAAQSGGLLTFFYLFVLLMLFLLSAALAWPSLGIGARRQRVPAGTAAGFASLAALLLGAVLLIAVTNVRVVQADMVYKRGKPFDEQATRNSGGDSAYVAEAWDAAIAIYDRAISLTPNEDFYYLFLGRALLERSAVANDPAEQARLLNEAEARLLEARSINPLNTDHTANLARLSTRWYGATADETERAERLELAEQYYRQALELSPQNSIIRNEYARLAFELKEDCRQVLDLYDQSVAIDPFYTLSFLARADAYVACGSGLAEPARTEFYQTAAGSLEQALEREPGNVRAWVQLAEVRREIGQYEDALVAVAEARAHNDDGRFPPAELDFLEARIHAGAGDVEQAQALAEAALTTASPETEEQINAFLQELEAGSTPD